jgi:hypothetical protein
MRAWAALDIKDIYHIMNSEHECPLLRLPRTMAVHGYLSSMNNGIETCCCLHYKLKMMGVDLSAPAYVYGDNMYVVHNAHRLEYVFKNKSNSICYHAVCDSAAMGESLIVHVPSVDNPDDICTKVVPGEQKHNHLICLLLHDLCD